MRFSTFALAVVAANAAVACRRPASSSGIKPTPAPTAVSVGAAVPTAEGGAGSSRAVGDARTAGGARDTTRRDTTRARGKAPSPRTAADTTAPDSVTATDVTRETARVFGTAAPPAPTDTMAAPGAPVWDIDVRSYETRKRVEDYVRIFSGRARGVFELALQRQTRYGPMIRERLRRSGLPEDFTYLALVESWFNPHAYSRAAAVGFWQFMAGTGRGMGLRVDWWIDERRDPVRSTDAAARLLRGMKDQFGSLYLAAAAYNGGEGRVSRGLARYADALDGVAGDDRFFALADKSYLRPETRDYVPKIIAAALVGEEPARYGVHVDSLPPYAYDSVRAPGGTPLAAVANAVGTTGDALSELNPHVLRGMTPPNESLWVRVPTGRAAGFEERFSALDPDERQALLRVESKKGQTMLSIAKAHGVTQKELGWYNAKVAKLKSGALRAGQLVLVPRRDVAALARDIPNPSIERYPRRRSSVRRHAVTSGETLGTIAKRYGVSVPTLMKLNGLKTDKLMPGQTIVVSGRSVSTAKPGAAKPKASSSGAKAGAAKPKSSGAKSRASSPKKSSAKKAAAKPAAKSPKP